MYTTGQAIKSRYLQAEAQPGLKMKNFCDIIFMTYYRWCNLYPLWSHNWVI